MVVLQVNAYASNVGISECFTCACMCVFGMNVFECVGFTCVCMCVCECVCV